MNKSKYWLLTFLVVFEFIITGLFNKLGIFFWTATVQLCFWIPILATFYIMFYLACKDRILKPKTEKILLIVLTFVTITTISAYASEILI